MIRGLKALPIQASLRAMLRELRARLGDASQEELARRLGVSWSTISRWEGGRGKPSRLARKRLVALLKRSGLEDLMGDAGLQD